MMDATCPPPTVLAMFDRIPTTKQILVEPDLAHDLGAGSPAPHGGVARALPEVESLSK